MSFGMSHKTGLRASARAYAYKNRPILLSALLLGAPCAGSGEALAAPYFQEVPNAFGQQPCQNAGCWTNYLRVTDIDGDKNLDVLFPNATGFFSKGAQAQPFVIYKNNGAAQFTDVSAASVGGYTNWLRQVAVGDVDGDGDPDIYAPTAWGDPDHFFINDKTGVFSDEAALRLPNVQSHAGAARFGDVDDDGDLDLLVGDAWAQNAAFVAHLYLNDGTGKFTDKSDQLPTTKKGTGPCDFDLLDADGDFDLDLLINMHQGTSSLWLNDGKGTFTDAPFPAQPANANKYGPVACDVDGDNDLDLWFDNAGPGYTEQLLINNGTGQFTDETAARVTGNPGADDNGAACIDLDGDGDFDVAIMSLSGNERVLANDGAGHFSAWPEAAFPTVQDSTLWFEFGDLNGDGRLDVVTGQGESGSYLNRVYTGTAMTPVDTVPPKFRAFETLPDKVPAQTPLTLHFAVSDNATTDEGPRLQKAYVQLTTPDSTSEVPAFFMGGDLFRAVLPPSQVQGQVSYAACAVDQHGNKGCALAKTFTVEGGSSGAGGSGGASGTGGAGGTSGGTGGAGGASSGTGGAGGMNQGGSAGFELSDGEGGCGCRLSPHASKTAGIAALLALSALRLRRRGHKRA